MISERTRVGLAATKARGVRLGNAGMDRAQQRLALGARRRLRETLRPLAGQSLRAIAATLNEMGIPAPRRGRWQHTMVQPQTAHGLRLIFIRTVASRLREAGGSGKNAVAYKEALAHCRSHHRHADSSADG
jgi:hypothetical protein